MTRRPARRSVHVAADSCHFCHGHPDLMHIPPRVVPTPTAGEFVTVQDGYYILAHKCLDIDYHESGADPHELTRSWGQYHRCRGWTELVGGVLFLAGVIGVLVFMLAF